MGVSSVQSRPETKEKKKNGPARVNILQDESLSSRIKVQLLVVFACWLSSRPHDATYEPIARLVESLQKSLTQRTRKRYISFSHQVVRRRDVVITWKRCCDSKWLQSRCLWFFQIRCERLEQTRQLIQRGQTRRLGRSLHSRRNRNCRRRTNPQVRIIRRCFRQTRTQ